MSAVHRDPFACIVLAAGAGVRFGMPKVEAKLPSGVRFLDAVVHSALAAGASPVVAVVQPGVVVPDGARAVVNHEAGSEQIASVRLGLSHLLNTPAVGALLWPVDHPLVQVESALAVVDAHRLSGAPIVIPVFNGRRGHPTFFARETWRDLVTADSEPADLGGVERGGGGGGARAVIHAYGSRVREVPVNDAGTIRDIDTLSDMPRPDRRKTDAVS